MIFGGGHGQDRDSGNIFGFLVMMIIAPHAAMIIQMAVSRSKEYGANVEGADLTGDPLALASTLRKLQMASVQIPLRINEATAEATAHMFIVNPVTREGLRSLFSTHPPDRKRHRPARGHGVNMVLRLSILASIKLFFVYAPGNRPGGILPVDPAG